MKQLPLCVLVALASTSVTATAARADALLTAFGDPDAIKELTHDTTVRFAGTIAVVETKQTFANETTLVREAVYRFDLPSSAAITSLSVKLANGHTTIATVVPNDAATSFIRQPGGLEASADVAILRMVDAQHSGGTLDRYELRVFPIEPKKSIEVTTQWLAPIEYSDGRLIARIPDRGDSPKLAREQVALTLVAPTGASGFLDVRANGILLANKATSRTGVIRFSAPLVGDVVIEATPIFRRTSPSASYAVIPLNKSMGVLAVSILAPRAQVRRATGFDRIIFVADVSRSMGQRGLAASRTLIVDMMSKVGPGTKIEAIVFDRKVSRVFGQLSDNDRAARKKLHSALTLDKLANGSDLGTALDEVAAVLLDARENDASSDANSKSKPTDATTLVVVVSDGMAPLRFLASDASDRIGADLLDEVEVVSINLVPDNAPLPSKDDDALRVLVHRTGGRSLLVRHSEAKTRAAGLIAELAQPAPLERLEVVAGSVRLRNLTLPATLESGSRYFALGWYYGKAPRRVAIRGNSLGVQVELVAKRGNATMRRAALPLVLVHAKRSYLFDRSKAKVSIDIDTKQRLARKLDAAARRVGVVTESSAIVALDSMDSFARDRVALAKKWGGALFRRLPPLPERIIGKWIEFDNVAGPKLAKRAPVEIRHTGVLGKAMVQRLVKLYVFPRARACFERLLRRQPKLKGNLVLTFEVVRGEVQFADIEQSSFSGGVLEQCVVDAAYAMHIPNVGVGDKAELIGLARYPLSFKARKKGSVVKRTPTTSTPDKAIDTADPLGGLPEDDKN